MSEISDLVAGCEKWQTRKKSLLALSKLSLKTKQGEVYAPVVDLAVRLFSTDEGAQTVYYELDPIVAFFLGELDSDPDVASLLYEAMPGPPIHNIGHFLSIVVRARDARALQCLDGLQTTRGVGRALIAIDAASEAKKLPSVWGEEAKLPSDPSTLTAAAFYAPSETRPALLKMQAQDALDYLSRPALLHAIALCGDPADADWVKSLGRQKDEASAKRLHAALCNPKLTDRIKTLDSIAKQIRTPETFVAVLLGLCRLLEDNSPDLVERAARALREHVRIGKKADVAFHKIFLRQAGAAIERGVTKDARKALDAVWKMIPRAEPFGEGPVATKGAGIKAPPKRKRKEKPKPVEPRWRKVRIDGAVVCESGAIYAMRRHGFDDEDEVILYRGVPSEKNQRLELHPVAEPREIRALVPLAGPWAEKAEVAALDADGEVWFVRDGNLDKEDVRGPRPKRGGYPFIGHMTRLRQRGERLHALGYGGQVYVRTLEDPWRPAGEQRPALSGYKVVFYDAVEQGADLLACGTLIGELDRAAVAKADQEDDEEAFANAFLKTPRDQACLWRLRDNEWQQVALGDLGVRSAFELFKDEIARACIVLSDGRVLRLDAAGATEIANLAGLADIKQSGGRVLALADKRLVDLSDGTPVDLGLPEAAKADAISVAGDHTIAVTDGSVLRLVEGAWKPLSCWIHS